jgi:3-oxoacyl-[acyl-carrier protein] reductase
MLSETDGYFLDKTALVTGSATGNGKAIAIGLATLGANIVVVDINKMEAEQTVAAIHALGCKAICIEADVSMQSEVNMMVQEALHQFGTVDILVNNAAIISQYDFLELSEVAWNHVIKTNLTGPFLCTQAVANAVIARHGKCKVINVSSIAAEHGVPQSAHYSAAKAGLEALTKASAKALASRGVHVNAVAPGMIETRMLESFLKRSGQRDRWMQEIPLERLGQPEDLVGAVTFLAGPASDYVTGTVVLVDGGWSA